MPGDTSRADGPERTLSPPIHRFTNTSTGSDSHQKARMFCELAPYFNLSLISMTHWGQEGARTTGEGFLVDSLQVGLLAVAPS